MCGTSFLRCHMYPFRSQRTGTICRFRVFGEIHVRPAILRLLLLLILIGVGSLTSGEITAQSNRYERASEVWNEAVTEPFVSFADEFPQTGPLFGAWGEYGTRDPSEPPDPIATDRPDFTESSTTVGAGVAQIEAGYTYSRDADDKQRGHSWGEPLLRVGVYADWLELRAALAPATEFQGGQHASGFEDLYLGIKLGLTSQSEWLPEVAIVPQLTVPTGHTNFTSNRTLPGCNLLYGWDVTETFSTAGSTQVNLAVDGDDAYVEWAQSWTVGLALAENVGLYSEWFALLPEQSADLASEHYLNGGITWQPTNDIQFDIRAGTGLNESASDLFCGVGLSLRFR